MLFAVPALLLLPPQSPDTGAAALRHADGRVPPTMTAVRVSRPPTLDGRLDDPAWAGAVPIRGFTETDPDEGKAASESTTVMLLYDADAIYVGARLYDDAPAKISSRLGRRDDNTQSDVFYVDFDSYHDHRTAFEFAVNPAGVKLDDLCSNDFFIGDRSWDPVWEVATAIDSLGWVVEMRIPFSQLRFPQVREQVWGVNFFRWVFRKNELSQWVFKKKTETGYASRFGHLVGLRDIPSPRRLELLPYTLGRGTYDSPAAGNPFDNGRTYFGGAGLDLKYGVTSNLTLDAAVNPDFGQVESDPSFVNLTAFEQFLPERRPFFVEGASIFDFGGTGPYIRFGNTPQYFYSRRIGRPPEHEAAAPSGGFVDAPTNSTILGSAKLSGKTPGDRRPHGIRLARDGRRSPQSQPRRGLAPERCVRRGRGLLPPLGQQHVLGLRLDRCLLRHRGHARPARHPAAVGALLPATRRGVLTLRLASDLARRRGRGLFDQQGRGEHHLGGGAQHEHARV